MDKRNNIEFLLKIQFEEAFRLYFHKIQFIARHYLKDMDLAQNVAQDVFISLWERRYEIDYSRPLLPYLGVITKNKCLNILKNQKIEQRYKDYNAFKVTDLKIDLVNNSTEDKLFSQEVERLVVDSMDKMGDKIRDAFIMSRFENKKYEEIAEIQRVSIKTIEYRIMSALKVLRKELKGFINLF